MQIAQSEQFAGDDWWNWSVWIEGSPEELDEIEWVEWCLHPTFPDPIRRVTDRSSGFRLDTGGWGVFAMTAIVHRKDGSAEHLRHHLQLHYPDGSENTA